MSLCPDCDGPVTRCQACGHHHCDDDTCRGMPTSCAIDLSAEDPGDGRW